MSALVGGLDVGGTKLLGVVLDPEDPAGSPLVARRAPTPTGTEALIDALVGLVGELVAEDDLAGRRVRAWGLGAPGLVDRTGTFRYGPNLPGVEGVALGAVLGERLSAPVVVDNDATCAAWAEHERGAARGRDHSVTITLGTGIGAGITVKGQVLRGAHGFAGELGHMVVDPGGPLCPCGRRGCWERYASGNGLAALASERLGRPVTGEEAVRAARAGEPEALAALDDLADWLGLGVANVVNLLDCEIVVIGGGLSGEADLFLPRTRVAARRSALGGEARPMVPIVAAHHGAEAGAVGAALLAELRT